MTGEQWGDPRLTRAHRDGRARLDTGKNNRLDKVVVKRGRVSAHRTLASKDRIGRNINTLPVSSCCVCLDDIKFLKVVAVSI